jgi:16S rRNA (cytosine967-C5)-methyltransferase
LQYEEGEAQVDRFLSNNTGFRRDPISLHEIGIFPDAINVNGDLRLLPYHLDQNEGVDGFFASRLTRK